MCVSLPVCLRVAEPVSLGGNSCCASGCPRCAALLCWLCVPRACCDSGGPLVAQSLLLPPSGGPLGLCVRGPSGSYSSGGAQGGHPPPGLGPPLCPAPCVSPDPSLLPPPRWFLARGEEAGGLWRRLLPGRLWPAGLLVCQACFCGDFPGRLTPDCVLTA